MITDLLVWWLCVELLGLAALPLAFLLFRNLADRGYTASKILGLVLVSYGLWITARFGLLPNSRGTVILLLIALACFSLILVGRLREELGAFFRERGRLVLSVEILFLVALLFGAWLRSLTPEILNTEKPMEFAFLNGILRSEHFPPVDPWLSGYSISYYYFGYVMIAVLVQLSGLASSIGFNLAEALLFALTAIGAYGLVYNLVAKAEGGRPVKAFVFAPLASLFVLVLGNLEGVLELLHAHGLGSAGFWSWIGVDGLVNPYQSTSWYPSEPGWWWWRATRLINTFIGGRGVDYTIEEFPIFSFKLGDMHPHVLALPLGLLALALALQFLSQGFFRNRVVNAGNTSSGGAPILGAREGTGGDPSRKDGEGPAPRNSTSITRNRPWKALLSWLLLDYHWLSVIAAMLILGSLGFANSWDFPTYLLIFFVAVAVAQYHSTGFRLRQLLPRLLGFIGLVAFGSILLYLPFYLEFHSQAAGILPVSGPGTRPLHYLIFWGFFLFLFGGLVVAEILRRPRPSPVDTRRLWLSLLVVYLPVLLWLLALYVKRSLFPSPETTPLNLWRLFAAPFLVGVTFYAFLGRVWPQKGLPVSLSGDLSSDVPGERADADPTSGAGPSRKDRPPLAGETPVTQTNVTIPCGVGEAGPAPTEPVGARFPRPDPRFPRPSPRTGMSITRETPAPPDGPDEHLSVVFVLLLGFVALFLTLGAELFFIADVFGNRMNTVFKFYYQAWVLLAIASAFALYYCLSRWRRARKFWRLARYAWWPALVLLLVAALIYPAMVLNADADAARGPRTLDGLAFVKQTNPDEYDAILWLQRNVRGTPVILEAPGEQEYSDFSRVSARTGLPTVIGWVGHELQWRGSDALFRTRSADVDRMYTSANQAEVLDLLHRYHVEYVYAGYLERNKYGQAALDRFANIGQVVFHNQSVTIYQVGQ